MKIPDEEKDRLTVHAQAVSGCYARIEKQTKSLYENRLLVILPARQGSQPLLNGTLPALIEKADDSGYLGIDLVLGLNDGADPPEILHTLDAYHTRVLHVYTGPQSSLNASALIYNYEICDGAPCHLRVRSLEQHAVYVVHQRASSLFSGQMRILRDLYAWCIRSIENGWVLPGTSSNAMRSLISLSLRGTETRFSILRPMESDQLEKSWN